MSSRRGVSTLMCLALVLVAASGAWAASEKVLYAFHGNDGSVPTSVIVGADGAFYGATGAGGTNCPNQGGCGVVFRLTRGAGGKWDETVLHDFAGSDGWFPEALVRDKAGNLYGTTAYGGPKCSQLGCGAVFELVRGGAAGGWTFKVLHYFALTDGANPYAGMIFDSKGNLYGTTSIGGNTSACNPPEGCGVVFELSPDSKGNWTEAVLYSFNGADGEGPGGLTLDSAGNLYGTTSYGGDHGWGTVFRLAPVKGGRWAHQILHSFDGADGSTPWASLTLDNSGNMYGTTPSGGPYNWGVAFKLIPAADGKWKETILRFFDRAKFGGGDLTSGLLLEDLGNLYGTAAWGGKYDCSSGGGLGCGVLFKLTPQADGKWVETVLHSFGGGNDGAAPGGDLARDSAGHLFGVTGAGGYTGYSCGADGCGVVFEVTP